MEIEEDNQVGFEEAMSWLPSHVVAEACDSNSKAHWRNESSRGRRHGLKLAADSAVPVHSRYSLKPQEKPRFPANWASGGPGMQAIFLDSGRKSCGTGVFLPRKAGVSFQPSRKPACSPVLLPGRVVQALNLDVHALGLQVSPHKDLKNNNSNNISKAGDLNSAGNKSGNYKEASTYQSSQEIFLPKEWTY